MSTEKTKLYHPVHGNPTQVWEGFSWPAFFLSGFWFLFKEMWIPGIIIIVLSAISGGIVWLFGMLIIPFLANGLHESHLQKEGYKTSPPDKNQAPTPTAPAQAVSPPPTPATTSSKSAGDRIKELQQLLDDGIINEDEFAKKKKEILGDL